MISIIHCLAIDFMIGEVFCDYPHLFWKTVQLQNCQLIMDAATNMIPTKPVLISIEIVCGLIWCYINYYEIDSKRFAFNYIEIIENKEWWRTISSSLSHIKVLHLAFNLVSLWSTGFMEQSQGSLFYFQLNFLLFIFSEIAMIVSYYIMLKYLNKYDYVKNMYAVGYSAILFGFMGYACILNNGNYFVFGFNIPFYLGPFIMLLLISLMIPNASFIGHLSGIIAGFIMGFINKQIINILFWLMFVQFIAIIIYSIYQNNLFGIMNTINDTANNNRKARIVNGVIVRGNDNV